MTVHLPPPPRIAASDGTLLDAQGDSSQLYRHRIHELIKAWPKAIFAVWSLAGVLFIAVIPAGYLSYRLLLELWGWAASSVLRELVALVPSLFIVCIPIWVFLVASWLAGVAMDSHVTRDEATIREAQRTVRETERQALDRLEETDSAGLLPLLKYSRAQLDAFYAVGLGQARRSYLNSLLAMWLGFVVLIAGAAISVVPLEQFGLPTPTQDFRVLVIGSGTIIEFISALFLWVYRNSIAQLTNFYNRQMQTHSAILCFRIASTMDVPARDQTKKIIVQRVLRGTAPVTTPPPPGARGIERLMGKRSDVNGSDSDGR